LIGVEGGRTSLLQAKRQEAGAKEHVDPSINVDVEDIVGAQSLWDYVVRVLAERNSRGKADSNSYVLANELVGEMSVNHSRSVKQNPAIPKNIPSKLT
jgi:hypothetical protein